MNEEEKKNSTEQWKNIQGYKGLYQISNYGRVKSLSRFHNNNKNSSIGYISKEKILKAETDGWGYLYVILLKDKERKKKKIHRLVAETFIPNLNNLPQVNHIDGNKKNNKVNNLEWCTREHNIQEAFRLGLIKAPKSKEHYRSKSVEQYDLQGNFIKEWNCTHDIERELNYRHTNISACCRGKIKKVYGYIWKYKIEEREEK